MMDQPDWFTRICTVVAAGAAVAAAIYARQAAKTWERTLETQRRDRSVARMSELQSVIHRCMSAIRRGISKEIWNTYTDSHNYLRRFRSAYEVASMYRSESPPNYPPDEIDKLLDRLRDVGRSVDAVGDEGATAFGARVLVWPAFARSPCVRRRPMTDDERRAYVIDMIRHRCPELGPDDLALLSPRDDPEEMLPASIVLQIVEVVDRMSERLAGFERQFAAAEPLPARLH
jgi:hypothetical protein